MAAALLRLTRPGTPAAACAEEQSLRANPYGAFQSHALAQDLERLRYAAAARADAGYAAALMPLRLAVLREHGETGAQYRQGQSELKSDRARWGQGPLPGRPALPVPQRTCGPLLAAEGFVPAGS